MAPNLSVYSIPVYWILALWPHATAINTIKAANNKKWDNANPRGVDTNNSYQKQVPKDVFCKYERCEAAHRNLLESAPLYIGAVVLGNMAKLDAATMNAAMGAYLGLRVVYVLLYTNTVQLKLSFLRTAVWGFSTGVLFTVIVMAGNRMV